MVQIVFISICPFGPKTLINNFIPIGASGSIRLRKTQLRNGNIFGFAEVNLDTFEFTITSYEFDSIS